MSDDTPRMAHLGKYLRDQFIDLDKEKTAHIEAGLAALSQEDREKFGGLMEDMYQGVVGAGYGARSLPGVRNIPGIGMSPRAAQSEYNTWRSGRNAPPAPKPAALGKTVRRTGQQLTRTSPAAPGGAAPKPTPKPQATPKPRPKPVTPKPAQPAKQGPGPTGSRSQRQGAWSMNKAYQ